MIKIGRFVATRPWQLVSYANPPQGWKYLRALDLPIAQLGVKNQFLNHTKWAINEPLLDGFITYNSIYHGSSKPWIIEVEDMLPRYGNARKWQLNYAVKKLSHPSCRAISFTSEFSRRRNAAFLRNHDLTHKAVINYRPVIPKVLENFYKPSEQFRILFVGNAFWRKGGLQLLRAFQRVSRKNWQLQIISSFEQDWAIFPEQNEIRETEKIIQSHSNIDVHSSVPFNVIPDFYNNSDVLVGFTYADTWYNSLMEAGAHGLALITSGISATTEMVSNEMNGFVFCDARNEARLRPGSEHVDWIGQMLLRYDNNRELLRTHQQASRLWHTDKFSIENRNKNLQNFFDFRKGT